MRCGPMYMTLTLVSYHVYTHVNVPSLLCRYYTTEFDWNENVVTIKQLSPLSKFDKWWMSKCMCIEGNL